MIYLGAFLAALKALPEMVGLFSKLVASFEAYLATQRAERIDHWIEEGRKLERNLQGAKTDEERQALLRELQRLRGSLPK